MAAVDTLLTSFDISHLRVNCGISARVRLIRGCVLNPDILYHIRMYISVFRTLNELVYDGNDGIS